MRGGSKKCKPILAPPRGAGLKSHPIPAPSPLRGGENPHGRSGEGRVKWGGAKLPSLLLGELVPSYISNLLLGSSSPRIYLTKIK